MYKPVGECDKMPGDIIIGEREKRITVKRRRGYLIFGLVLFIIGIIIAIVHSFYAIAPVYYIIGGILIGVGIMAVFTGLTLTRYCWVTK
ncbi:MAG: hypothetical protein B2I17_05560 [Thermoplasmatales archaeon B_DKE]|nr:MAG: hypothetical protein B2I17_05560 [Thermoplasmatales archaeon B_DKE]